MLALEESPGGQTDPHEVGVGSHAGPRDRITLSYWGWSATGAQVAAVRHGWASPVDGQQWRAERVILGALALVSLSVAVGGTLPYFGGAGGYPATVG
jgi:hypothetical protein